jgi:hypothetical protein
MKTNTYLTTCIPSRISTFLGTAEDLRSQSKNPKIKNRKSDLKNRKYHKIQHTSVHWGHIPALHTERGPSLCRKNQHQQNGAYRLNPCNANSNHCQQRYGNFLSNYATALFKNRTKDFNLSIRW